ncbi:hypothetical protein T11_5983 [Trichinella zimbabwensis]|uniref:Uncharacterized protein n=1 Tax=Trichinella zimbabwensis TaxID=268475 RepID=A0A0V1I3Q9_9BILA|nr:hypothetical protein T11_5983 [Trichinella zimbabwensis]
MSSRVHSLRRIAEDGVILHTSSHYKAKINRFNYSSLVDLDYPIYDQIRTLASHTRNMHQLKKVRELLLLARM